jgi:hypothetical protein
MPGGFHAHVPPLEIVLSRFPQAIPSGDGYVVACPTTQHARGDRRPDLQIDTTPDGTVLLRCDGSCDIEAILSAIGLRISDLYPHEDQRAAQGDGGGGEANQQEGTATVQPSTVDGCTLASYAAVTGIPVTTLMRYRLSQVSYLGVPSLRIAYVGTDLTEAAVKFRVSLHGEDSFFWRKGSKPILYGLWRWRAWVEREYVVLVGTESDCHILWYQQFPAVGLPGASNWREDRDAVHFDKIPDIYVIRTPDTITKAVYTWLAGSRIRNRARLVTLGEFDDLSHMYMDNPKRFSERFQAALDAAVPWVEVEAADAEERQRSAWLQCAALAHEPRILDRFTEILPRAGVVGERHAAQLLFLVISSRLLAHPVSAVVKGPSATGKSFVAERILTFFPASAYYALSSLSDRALAYSREPVSHRVLVIYEDDGLASEFVAYLMRSLLSEGRIRYETLENTRDGIKTRLIEREGPTSILTTTTAIHVHPENETRVLSIGMTDTPDQTREVLRRLAKDDESEPLDVAPWHALQEWLAGGPTNITIPFAEFLAELVPPVALRLRRDFAMVLTLIRTHALLHRANRDVDERGRVVATLDDYSVVRDLVADLVSDGVEATVSSTVRETVNAVESRIIEGQAEVQITGLASFLGLDKATTLRRVRRAINLGYLRNLETGRGRPARLTLGEPMPDDAPILPTVEALEELFRRE